MRTKEAAPGAGRDKAEEDGGCLFITILSLKQPEKGRARLSSLTFPGETHAERCLRGRGSFHCHTAAAVLEM